MGHQATVFPVAIRNGRFMPRSRMDGGSMSRLVAFLALVGLALVSGYAQTAPPDSATATLPDGAGKPIVQKQCVMCHSLSVVTSKRASHTEWTQVVNQMVSRGADLSDDEIDTVIEYLSSHYGPLDQKATPSTSSGAGDQASSSDPSAPSVSPDATPSPAAGAASTPVNVNKASAQDLESSLGLAKTEAEAVVRYREQNGNFKTWHEVAAVPGVSAAKIEAVQKRMAF
jgi:competence ComEA-like helix-hairpin-helix protein